MTMPALSITWLRRGDFVEAPTPLSPGATETYMVLSRCDEAFAVWFCESCRCNLANIAQIEMHAEKGGKHRIAMWCDRHRVYEEAAPIVLQAVAL